MFNNQMGGQAPSNQRPNINTSLQSFFGDNVMFTTALWNDKVSLSWTPSLGQDANGITRYDRDHRINTALSATKIAVLVKGYDKYLKKYVDGEEELPDGAVKSIGVQVGGNRSTGTLPGVFSIEVCKLNTEESKDLAISVSIAKNVSEMGTTEENVTRYTFNRTPILLDYNPTSGGESIEDSLCGEFDVFMDILRNHVQTFGLQEHAHRYLEALFPGRRGNGGNHQSAQLPENPATSGFGGSGTEYEFPFN